MSLGKDFWQILPVSLQLYFGRCDCGRPNWIPRQVDVGIYCPPVYLYWWDGVFSSSLGERTLLEQV